jgi:hypothetical protein
MKRILVIVLIILMGLGMTGCAEGLDNDIIPSGKGIVSKPTHTPEATIEEELPTYTPTEFLTEIPPITPTFGSSVTPTVIPSDTPFQDVTETGTPQPNISVQTDCGIISHLQIGMWAFAQMELRVFNKGRYRNSTTNPVSIITILPVGTRVNILGPTNDGLYQCTLNSLMWQISYEGMPSGQDCFAFEFYNPRSDKDDPQWLKGYYLTPYPPQ